MPRRFVHHPSLPLLGLALALCLALGAVAPGTPAAGAEKRRIKVEELPPQYQAWLEEVRLLITKEERRTFLEIEQDYQRDAFIERFWKIRDPFPGSPRNELRDKWEERVSEARRMIGDLEDPRADILLLNGLPSAIVPFNCFDLWPGEVWYYERVESLGHPMALLFYQPGRLGRHRLWHPTDGYGVLMQFSTGAQTGAQQLGEILNSCRGEEGDAVLAALQMAHQIGSLGFQTTIASMLTPQEQPSGEWVATFNAMTTDLPEDAATFPAELEFEYPGRHKSRTVVQGVLSVDPADAGVSELAGHRSYNFVLTGEVLREGRLFDSFRYSYNIPEAQVVAPPIPLLFERYLRPGDYEVVLKLEDSNGKAYFGERRPLAVPSVEAAPPPPSDPETARILAEANAAITSGETTLEIVPPGGELQTGMLRVDTLTTGSDVDHVAFELDGRPVLTKRSPPFNVELNLGSLPRLRALSAVAYDADGKEVARDEMALNSGSHRFDVRLVEPRRGRKYSRSLRAEAAVEVPEGKVVERVEFFLNEDRVATLHQEPFVQPIVLPEAEQVAYVRAVAYLPDGLSTEDLVFVNAPDYLEEVDVQFVELYITVLDKQKRPVAGLTVDDFAVSEDNVPQAPARFDLVSNLPIHAGILLDVSASMEESLDTARAAAVQFFEQAVTPKDRATLVTFNDHPHLATKFTNELQQLAGGLAGLKAERGTALYDSLVFALYYFNGIKGQRALIVLSDGKDEHSRFTYEDTLEYARRAGVAIYAIGLNLKGKHGEAKRKLAKLAEETGGRGFFIDDASELSAIYADIQRELRSRYYLAYQSTNISERDEFRTIEVEMARSGLEAKTLRGYYP